jgi:hypothetical protein
MGDVVVSVERQTFDVLLGIVRTDKQCANTSLYRAYARGGGNSLSMRQACHAEDAGETADKNMPLQQDASLESVTCGVS